MSETHGKAIHLAVSKKRLLHQIPMFATLPLPEIEYLATSLRTRQIPAGEIVIQEGESAEHFYILQDGQVEIIKALGTQDERFLAVRTAGTLLGEMSLFTPNKAHTASVRSLTELIVLEMTRSEFDALLHRQPDLAYEIARTMILRLEESENLTILDLREKNRQLTLAYEEIRAAHEQIIEKELLEKELQIARQIQDSILPQTLPKTPGYDLGALMVPARAVGGDFYDFIPLGKDLLGVVVGDVSDKGVPSALFMALTYSLVRAEAGRTITPGDTLRSVNHHMLDINVTNMFVTLLYGILHLSSGRFQYARAGQIPPLLLDGEARALKTSYTLGQSLGLFKNPQLDEQEIEIPGGGSLLLFSDGLTEAMDTQGRYFGIDLVHEVLSAERLPSAQADCEALWKAVHSFSSGLHQSDDFTVAVVRRLPPGSKK